MYVLHIIQCLKKKILTQKYFNLCYYLKVNYTYETISDIYDIIYTTAGKTISRRKKFSIHI